MNLRVTISSVVLAGAICLTLAPAVSASVVERVVAVVGDNAILLSELRRNARPYLLQIYARSRPGPQRAAQQSDAYKRTLQRMIERKLIARAAAKHHVRVTDQEVDAAIERLARVQKLTVRKLMREVLRSGMSMQAYRQEIRSQLLEGKMLEVRVKGQVRVTEDDMRLAYDQMKNQERMQLPYHARWIVLRAPKGQLPAKRRLAAMIEAELRRGETFQALASRYSDDTATKASGGDLGEHRPGELAEVIEKHIMELEPGQVSAPFRFRDALLIVKLESRDKGQLPPFEQARDRLARHVYAQKLAKARERWIQQLKRGIHVDVRL